MPGQTHYFPNRLPYDPYNNPEEAEPSFFGVVGGPDTSGIGYTVLPANTSLYFIIAKRQAYTLPGLWNYGDWIGLWRWVRHCAS